MGVVLVRQGLRQGWSAEGQSSLGLALACPKALTRGPGGLRFLGRIVQL